MVTPTVNTFFNVLSRPVTGGIRLRTVGKRAKGRAVKVPRFGAALVQARGNREKQRVIARMHAISDALLGFSRPQLDRYEHGQVEKPDPVVLFYLAQHYQTDVLALISLLAQERTGNSKRGDPAEPSPAAKKRAS